MNGLGDPRDDALSAVLRTAQYLALLRGDADIWRELGEVLTRFFGADLVALLERRPDGALAARYCTLSEPHACERLAGEVGEIARQVLTSGFLASEVITLADHEYAIALLPLAGSQQTDTALLIGHRGSRPLPQSLLDIYLAVAGLFESTMARLASEQAAIENAQRFEEQRRIAVALQENFLSPLPKVQGLEMGLVMQTAFQPELVGGDFSDVFVLADGRVAILIGDVAGKGVAAAGMTETVRSTVRAFAAIDAAPAFVLRRTNELLLRHHGEGSHVTACFCVFDPAAGRLAAASAGHPPPLHLSPSSCRPLGVSFGPPLGSFASDFPQCHTMLGADDYLVLYTDGVTEARRSVELFGEKRLAAAVFRLQARSPQAVAEGVRDDAAAFGGRLGDDLEVLALRFGAASQ